MLPITEAFKYDYDGSEIVFGRGCIDRIGEKLETIGFERAMIICGSHVGANEALMGPLKSGLDDSLVGVFDGTTPDKTIGNVFDAIEMAEELDPDVVVGVGGGSAIDVARQTGVFQADGRSIGTIRSEAESGTLEGPDPDGDVLPAVVVPTTFAGADLSDSGSIEVLPVDESPTDQPIRIRGTNMPRKLFYDPNLFETTPSGALAGSAMNGFNKGLETIYGSEANPVTTSTSMHGLRLLDEGFTCLGEGDPAAMERAVIGMILVQFKRKTSIIHAFGHGFSRRYTLQQGRIHAVMAPHVLEYLFSKINLQRQLLAEAFGIDTESRSDKEVADDITASVIHVRDSFDLPKHLREIDPIDEEDFPDIAEFIINDSPMARAPNDLKPTTEEIEAVLHEAW
jgi:alcohol dehydrogenase